MSASKKEHHGSELPPAYTRHPEKSSFLKALLSKLSAASSSQRLPSFPSDASHSFIPDSIQELVNNVWACTANIGYNPSYDIDLLKALGRIPNLDLDRCEKIAERWIRYSKAAYSHKSKQKQDPQEERQVKLMLMAVALGETGSAAFWAHLALNNGNIQHYGAGIKEKSYPIRVTTDMLMLLLVHPL
jgi:hypothetical protein